MTEPTEEIMKVSGLYNFLMSIGVMGTALVLVIFWPQVTKVITIMGGYLSCTLGILYPSFEYVYFIDFSAILGGA